MGVLAAALQAALVQDYDGLVRIAPAWPKDWDGDGTVYIRHGGKVNVQIRQGKILTVGIEAGSSERMRIRSPWPGQPVEVVDTRTSALVVPANSDATFAFFPQAGRAYLVRLAADKNSDLPFQEVSGIPATCLLYTSRCV